MIDHKSREYLNWKDQISAMLNKSFGPNSGAKAELWNPCDIVLAVNPSLSDTQVPWTLVGLGVIEKKQDHCWIHSVCTGGQRTGCCTKLMHAVISLYGAEELRLKVQPESNPRAFGCYEKTGFVKWKQEEEDVWILRRKNTS